VSVNRNVTPDELDGAVEFDSPFRINADGTLTSWLHDVWAPDVTHVEWTGEDPAPRERAERGEDVAIDDGGWQVWSIGYSGQDRYRGGVMHSSEYLGGRMASDLLADPGTYVICSVEVDDEETGERDETPAGWVILKRTEEHPGMPDDCAACAAAEPMVHTYEPPAPAPALRCDECGFTGADPSTHTPGEYCPQQCGGALRVQTTEGKGA
jgi:hypothetical protein